MSAKIIDGKAIAARVRAEVAEGVKELVARTGAPPDLAGGSPRARLAPQPGSARPRDPRAASAPQAHRPGSGDRPGRAREGRGRLRSAQRRGAGDGPSRIARV